jgi:ribosomal protein L20
MPRSKNKVASHRRRKKIMQMAKGFEVQSKSTVQEPCGKGLTHAYRDGN